MEKEERTNSIMKGNNSTVGSMVERMLVAEDVLHDSDDHRALHESTSLLTLISWRETIIQWFYDFVDYRDEPRSVVYVATNILDRFTAVKHLDGRNNMDNESIADDNNNNRSNNRNNDGIRNHNNNGNRIGNNDASNMDSNGLQVLPSDNDTFKRTYKIAAMASIFLAVRVAGSGNFRITDHIRANSDFDVQDIIRMGKEMLASLTWGIRLSTPHDFIDAILRFLPASVSSRTQHSIYSSAYYLAELAVFDIHLSQQYASKIAMAAVLNSLEGFVVDNELTDTALATFRVMLPTAICRTRSTSQLSSIRCRLNNLYNHVEIGEPIHDCPHYISDEEDEEQPLRKENDKTTARRLPYVKRQQRNNHDLDTPEVAAALAANTTAKITRDVRTNSTITKRKHSILRCATIPVDQYRTDKSRKQIRTSSMSFRQV